MTKEFEEAMKGAIAKMDRAWSNLEAALLAGNREEFNHWHSEYVRYLDAFAAAVNMTDEEFLEFVEWFRERQNKSE